MRYAILKADLIRQFDEQERSLSSAFRKATRSDETAASDIESAKDRLTLMRNIVNEMLKDDE